MKFDGIIFDKDGTLINFDAFWISISEAALRHLLRDLGREDIPVAEILEAMGVRDGVSDPDGLLLKGTYEDMGAATHGVLTAHGCGISREEAVRRVVDVYEADVDAGKVVPTCPGLADTLKTLYEAGVHLAVLTSDNRVMTQKCLQDLGVEQYFETVYTDDGEFPHKPDPFCAMDFCRRTGISKERLLMVGDTLTDVQFARNAGIPIYGVAENPVNREFLRPHVDVLIREIAELPGLLED